MKKIVLCLSLLIMVAVSYTAFASTGGVVCEVCAREGFHILGYPSSETSRYGCNTCTMKYSTFYECSEGHRWDIHTEFYPHETSGTTTEYCPYCGEPTYIFTNYICGWNELTTDFHHSCAKK